MAYGSTREHYAKTLSQIRSEGLYKDERLILTPQSSEVEVRFPSDSPARQVINLCANNYLGLSSHPEVLKAAHHGLDRRGYGMSSVRFICGTQDIHRELEHALTRFLGTEDTILFSSCFDANAALFETVLGPEDAVFSDRLVHASLIDGMRLCKAEKKIFDHQRLDQLESELKISKARIKMIITDGVFSMDGDMARLDLICDLADRYGAMVAVDDSHATGFIGKTGRGTHEYFGVMDRVDIITTTLGKALGGATGGCISGRKEMIELLKQRGRPYLFSNALMPAVVMASLKVLELLSQSTERRDHLERMTEFWRAGLEEAGFTLKPGNTPIIPVMLGDASLSQQFSRELYQEGVFAVGFFYPVVPKGEARIRTQISASHTQVQLERALDAFVRVGRKLKVIAG